MDPDLHLKLHADRVAAASRHAAHRHALPQRPRPPSRAREAAVQGLRRLADALEPAERLPRHVA